MIRQREIIMAKNKAEFERLFELYFAQSDYDSQTRLATDLNVDKSTLTKWIQGVNHIKPEKLERVSVLLKLTVEQKEALFDAAGYLISSRPDNQVTELFADLFNKLRTAFDGGAVQSQQNLAVPIDPLPSKPYLQFIGRTMELQEVVHQFEQGAKIINLRGLGGIGKTALARETVDYLKQKKFFKRVVWTSAKFEELAESHIVPTQERTLYGVQELLGDMARQLELFEILKLTDINSQKAALRKELNSKAILVVVDNLETVTEVDRVVSTLADILGQSNCLLTSRHRVSHDNVYDKRLVGLLELDSLQFLRVGGKQRNVRQINQATESQLRHIYEVTGGAPLAMNLVVGQANYQPITDILDDLRQARLDSQDEAFYRFVYRRSWDKLSRDAKHLLIELELYEPMVGVLYEELKTITYIKGPRFIPAYQELFNLSLLEGSQSQLRCILHPLTHYFIKSDIRQEWEK